MKFRKFFSKLLRSADLFGTNEFFRYNSSQTFQSFFGGIFSILVVIAIGVISYNRIIECLSKVNIDSSSTKIIQGDPPFVDMSTYPLGHFMAALSVPDLDLSDPTVKFFNGDVLIETADHDVIIYDLEKCTEQHWAGVPEISQDLKQLNISRMLCLPLNTSLFVQGKYTLHYNAFTVEILKNQDCPPDGQLPRCPTDEDKRKFFGNQKPLKVQLYFVNYQISPGKPDYIKFFLDDRVFGYFTQTIGNFFGITVQDFTINTDEGISYLTYPVVKSGGWVDEQPTQFQYVLVRRFAQFQFSKSLVSRLYFREYQKIQDVFSQMGGLFSAICALLFILKSYNDSAYSISIGFELFKTDQIRQEGFFKKYRFWNYLKVRLFNFLPKLRITRASQSTIEYGKCQTEVAKCVDVLHLLKRVGFLEDSMSVILQKHQSMGLHLRQKLTFDETYQQQQILYLKRRIDRIRQSELVKRHSVDSNFSNPLGHQRQMTEESFVKEENDESVQKNAIQLYAKSIFENKDSLFRLKSKNSTHRSEISEQSQDCDEQNLEKDRAFQQQLVNDLSRVQKQAKNKGKRISRNIMNLSRRSSLSKVQNQSIINLPKNDIFLEQMISPQNRIQNAIQLIRPQILANLQKPKDQLVSQPQKSPFVQAQQKAHKIFKIFNPLKKLIKSIDAFSATKLLRFQSETEYKTHLGGVVSIFMVCTLFSLFYMKFNDCVNKKNVFVRDTKIFSNDPTFLEISTYPKGNFMGQIEITGLNLNENTRVFDILLENRISRLNETTGKWDDQVISYPLEKCTLSHWGQTPEFYKEVSMSNYNNFLCFPKGISLSIQGKKSSNQFRTIELVVKNCSNATDPSRPCNYTGTQDFLVDNPNKDFFARILNVVINPQSSKYIQFFRDERLKMFFSIDMISDATVYFDDYTVNTDQSIFPWTDYKIDSGSMITQKIDVATNDNLKNVDGYIRIQIQKSFNTILYERSFQKVQESFTFIGGFIGIFFTALFIVKTYNVFVYETIMSYKLFKTDKNNILFKNHNILRAVCQSICSFVCFSFVKKFSTKWQWGAQKKTFQKQLIKQIDVASILKKLDFVQSSVSAVLERHQMLTLHIKQSPSLEEAKEKRKAFKLRKNIFKIIQTQKNSKRNEKKDNDQPCLVQVQREFGISNIYPDIEKKDANVAEQQNITAVKALQDPSIDEYFSSESQSDSDIENEVQRQTIVENIRKLDMEAKNGDEVSQKIINLVNRRVSSLLKQKLNVFDLQGQIAPVRRSKANVVDISEDNCQSEDISKNVLKTDNILWKVFSKK